MPTRKAPRKGSLQFWPRKRASKFLPRVNWNAIKANSKELKGFIGYKAGMASVIVKDSTPDSMTKEKRIAIPVTIIECPPMKILSVRFYRDGRVQTEVLTDNLEKDLKKKIKLPKKKSKQLDEVKDYDDIKVLVYSVVKKTAIKKKADFAEVGLVGNIEEKINYVKSHLGKEISIFELFENGQLVDLRGLTKGKGFQGPVRRFGITLKSHKSEKGVRRPGSIGAWHPARTTFRAPMAGQLGMFTRVTYNKKIVDLGKGSEKDFLKNIKNYGTVKSDYIIVEGSVQGSAKRQLIISAPLRTTKRQTKKSYELIEVVR